MRTEQRESKSSYTVYIAEDGSEFNNREECEIYDNTAKCVLRSKIKSFTVKQLSEEELFNIGSDEYEYIIVHPVCSEDIESILRLMKLYNIPENIRNKAQDEICISNDYLFGIGSSYEDYDNMWYYGSCEDVVNNIRKRMGIDDDLCLKLNI